MSKQARRYELLAAWARDQGYAKVTGATLHSWVKRRLLLHAVVTHPAFGVRSITEPPDMKPALLAACRIRYDYGVRSIPLVGAAMYVDGYPVDHLLAREGLNWIASAPSRLVGGVARARRRSETANADVLIDEAAVAAVDERELFKVYRPAGRQPGFEGGWDVTAGFADWLRLLLNPIAPPDRETLRSVGKAMGLAQADLKRDMAEAMIRTAPFLRPDVLAARIANTSEESLGEARSLARDLLAGAEGLEQPHPVFKVIVLLVALAVGEFTPQRVT